MNSAMPMLAGTARPIAMTAVNIVPYTKSSAPKWFRFGFQPRLVMKLAPWCANAGEGLPVVEHERKEALQRLALRLVRLVGVHDDPRRRRDRIGVGTRRVDRAI